MSTPGWRKNTPVIRKLTESAHDYSFVQAVRLLERAALMLTNSGPSDTSVNPVGGFTPPSTEPVRFSHSQTLEFTASEIDSVNRSSDENDNPPRWDMRTNLIGLTGSMGVLPYHYTELILRRRKLKDDTMRHFLDLFNHRIISQYYRASVKYRPALQYERHLLFRARPDTSPHTQALLSIIGLGTEGLRKRQYTQDESLLYYAGLFSQKTRTVGNLVQILRSHFKIPVGIRQFVGQWQELIDDVRTRLPDIDNPGGRNAVLGRSAMVGKKAWFTQGKIYIILGPLSGQQLQDFAPGTATLKALNEMVRMYVGMEIDYEFKIRIYRRDIPEKMQLTSRQPPIIGWNSWLTSKTRRRPGVAETLDISVSASQLR